MYARIKHDPLTLKWHYKPRSLNIGWKGLSNPPETCPYYNVPAHGKGGYKLRPQWDRFLYDINWGGFWLRDKPYKGIMNPKAGWVNGAPNHPDTLTFGGNVIEIDQIHGKFYRAKAFGIDSPAPSASIVNYKTHPELIHKFVAIRKNGGLMRGGNGLFDMYVPMLKINEAWFDEDRLEFFPPIGTSVMSDKYHLTIRLLPAKSEPFVGLLMHGESAVVMEYAVSGGDVWGRINDGWICLQEQVKPAVIVYHTNWSMKTVPPL
jgi:hypothetical protein